MVNNRTKGLNNSKVLSDTQQEKISLLCNIPEIFAELGGIDVTAGDKILCLWHEEKSGSLLVDNSKCFCFGCGVAPGPVDVVRKLTDKSFWDSVHWLDDYFNLDLFDDDKSVEVKKINTIEDRNRESTKAPKPAITPQEYQKIKSTSSERGNNFRGISDAILKASGVRTEYDENGEVCGRWYMATEGGKLVGMKKRVCTLRADGSREKNFYSVGRVGVSNELYGARHYKGGGKTLLIVGGEEDREAALEMLTRPQFKSTWVKPAVVSPSTGESSIKTQLKNNYAWINTFSEIILALDSDEAGQKAMEECLDILPKNKTFKIIWQEKDPNDYLMKDKVAEFVYALFNTRQKHIPVGIVSSSEMREAAIEELSQEKIRLPKFMRKIEEMSNGGFSRGTINNIGGMSGIGKTSLIGEAIYFWTTSIPQKPLPVSLELSKRQYSLNIYSRHLGVNLRKLPREEAIKTLEDSKEKLDDLDYLEGGVPRYFIIDDRDGSIEDLQSKVEEAIIVLGVELIIFDPLNDLFDGLDIKDQESFMRWEKRLVKRYPNIVIINICHFNKAGSRLLKDNKGRIIMPQEADLDGSGTIFKSGAINILMARDKNHPDLEERNKTYAVITKGRGGVQTGPCGPWYYDSETHTMYDYDDWVESRAVAEMSGSVSGEDGSNRDDGIPDYPEECIPQYSAEYSPNEDED